MNDDWLVLGCAVLAIMLALVGIVLPEQTEMTSFPYGNLTGVPSTFPYGNLTNIPSTFPYGNLTNIPSTFPYGNLTGVPQTFPYGNLTGIPITYNLTDNLVLYMPLNDGIGNASDYSGFMNHGNIYSASWVDGKYGKALNFNGVSDYVLCPDIGNFNQLTVAVWVKGKTLKSYGMIVTKDDNVTDRIPFEFGVYSTTGVLRFAAFIGEVWGDNIFNTVLVEDILYHVAITYDGFKKRCYVNGVKESNEFSATGSIVGVDRVMVGARKYTAPEYFWEGIIDEIRIYNRALTQNEITLLYNLP